MGAELFVEIFMACFAAGCVFIHPECSNTWHEGVERSFNVFCAKSFELEGITRAAIRTAGWNLSCEIAEMATELFVRFMEGESEIAVGAFDGGSAGGASLGSVVAATIEEEKCLFSHFESFF